MHIPITGFAAAACGLLLLFLSLRISQLRLRHQIALGDGGNSALLRAIRVHGNTTEHAPIFLLQCACYEISGGAGPSLMGLVALFLLARLLFAWGLSRRTVSLPRRAGAALTYLAQFGLSLLLLVQVFSSPR